MKALERCLGQPPKALLFDLDGTLVDSASDLIVAINAMLHELKLEAAEPDKIRQWIGNGARKLVERALKDVNESVSDCQLDESLDIFYRHYDRSSGQQTIVYEGVLPALERWKAEGIKMACVTNKPMQFTLPLLSRFKLDTYLPVVLGGDSLSVKKPHPAPLLKACELLEVDPVEAMMIGDSINDVQAARAAKMKVICVSYGYNYGAPIRDAQPDLLIDNFLELVSC